jgi:hypothetical protein
MCKTRRVLRDRWMLDQLVTWYDLKGGTASVVRNRIRQAVEYYETTPKSTQESWKTDKCQIKL